VGHDHAPAAVAVQPEHVHGFAVYRNPSALLLLPHSVYRGRDGHLLPIRNITRLNDLHVTFPEIADDLLNTVNTSDGGGKGGTDLAAREAAHWNDHSGGSSD
jgi:hypothetical protein